MSATAVEARIMTLRGVLMEPSVHLIVLLVLVGRLGDLITTWLATPRLVLEANPIARQGAWRFALGATFLLLLVPYLHAMAGLAVAVTSLFVAASNALGIWMARALGEDEYFDVLRRAARRSSLRAMIACKVAAGLFVGLAGGLLCFLTREREAFWFGGGVIGYAAAIVIHGTLGARRLHRSATS